jgi:hypothetical protein
MRESVGAFPLLRTIVYFNARDSYAWVSWTKPDWRLRDPNPVLGFDLQAKHQFRTLSSPPKNSVA